jgi:tetraacyldisaccharide 4'-kinase
MIAALESRVKVALESLESFAVDVIYDRRDDFPAQVFGAFLKALSFLFGSIVIVRQKLYEWKILKNQPLGCLVVVVGNLTVGGTGKTPIVESFARKLQERGRNVAILSRGYKSKKEAAWKSFWRWITHQEEPPPRIVSNGKAVLLDSEQAGDEAFMLARNLPGVCVLTDTNRVKAGFYAVKNMGVDTLVLDDGYQYVPLKGRLNLLLIDKGNPFGNESLLPRGILREPIAHMKRASYIFLTKSNGEPDTELVETIRKHHPRVEIIECAHQPRYLQDILTGERQPLTILKGTTVSCFSGIATPENFESSLIGFGARLKTRHRFLDHHRFTEEELGEILDEARRNQVQMIVTTEKDAVRLPEAFESPVPFFYLRLEIEILSGAHDFEEAVARICFPHEEIRARRKKRNEEEDDE